jgi:hypothetical protein
MSQILKAPSLRPAPQGEGAIDRRAWFAWDRRVIVAFIASLLLISCKKAPPPPAATPVPAQPEVTVQTAISNAPAEPPPAPPTPSAQVTQQVAAPVPVSQRVEFKPKWLPGHRYVYRMDLEQHSTNQVPNAPQSIAEQMTMGLTYALSVQEEARDGGHELAVKFLAFELEIKVGQKAIMTFDSGNTNQTPDPMLAPFQKLIGSKLTMRVDPQGKIGKVSALPGWLQGVTAGKQGAAELMVVQQFNEGFFQQLADFGRGLPTQTVEPGASWPYKTEMPAGEIGTIAVESTLTLRRLENHENRRLALIESQGTLRGIPNPQSSGSMRLETGNVAGTLWFDPEMGGPVESNVEQMMRLKGDAPEIPELKRPAVTFTSDIAQKVTLKLVELTKETR